MDTVHECDRQIDGRSDGRPDRQTDRITITDTVQRIASGGNKKRPPPCTYIYHPRVVLFSTVPVCAFLSVCFDVCQHDNS